MTVISKRWHQLRLVQRNSKSRLTMKVKTKVMRSPMNPLNLLLANPLILAQPWMLRSPRMARGRERKAKPTSRSPLGPWSNASSTSTSSVKLIVHRVWLLGSPKAQIAIKNRCALSSQ